MKNNFVKMWQCFVDENLLCKIKSKLFSFLKTQIYKSWKLDNFGEKIFEILFVFQNDNISVRNYVKYVNFSFFYFDNNSAHGH